MTPKHADGMANNAYPDQTALTAIPDQTASTGPV